MARPTKLDDLVAQRICNSLEAGNARSTAARSAGVGWSTLRGWLARGRRGEEPFAAFLARVKRAEAKGEEELVATIRASAPKTWTCAAWLLERRFPARWARREAPELMTPTRLTTQTQEEICSELAELAAGNPTFRATLERRFKEKR